MMKWICICLPFWMSACLVSAHEVRIGSKIFTESYILAEIAAVQLENADAKVERKSGLGNSLIAFEALRRGDIDFYPDYTGTLAEEILKRTDLHSFEQLQNALAHQGLVMSMPLGFSNSYALAVRKEVAQAHQLKTISDLNKTPALRFVLSYEFTNRRDGFENLQKHYQLKVSPAQIQVMDHMLAFQAIASGRADITDVYTTDAKVDDLQLITLEDDAAYFPRYDAVYVARLDFIRREPGFWRQINDLSGRFTAAKMRQLNARVDLHKQTFHAAAAAFYNQPTNDSHFINWTAIGHRAQEHLLLVLIASLFAVCLGVPAGIVAYRTPSLMRPILILAGVLQTIPSLALLSLCIPFLGVGLKPAIAALCVYGLLPVVLNTYSGLSAIDGRYVETARALGLTQRFRLLHVELPLAFPAILAGVQTSVVTSIGTATLAALVGAGGFGAPIVTGLATNDWRLVLTGAVPAAVGALIANGIFEVLEKTFAPPHSQKPQVKIK